MSKKIFQIVKEYSESSSIQGLSYIFENKQTTCGKIFWTSVVVFMMLLGAYWSVVSYTDWQDKLVLTTVKTSAFPVKEIEFPAVTICGKGMNTDIFGAGFFKYFFKFLKQSGVPVGISPIKAATLYHNALVGVSFFTSFKTAFRKSLVWADLYMSPVSLVLNTVVAVNIGLKNVLRVGTSIQ